VVDDQLRAPVEELGQRLRALVSVEDVLLVNRYPRQFLPLPRELVAAAGELLLALEQLTPSGKPLLTRRDRVLGHLVPSVPLCRGA